MFIINTSKNMFNHVSFYNIKYIRKECDKSYDAWIICNNCVKKLTMIGLALSIARATTSI